MLNPYQLEAVRAQQGSILVVSGPGSGKTRVLTSRIAALLKKGTDPRSIMAITFTNRAAAEMRERVENLVGKEESDKVWIGTFHSSCVRILRMWGDRINIPRNFVIYDSDDSKKTMKQALIRTGLVEEKVDKRIVSHYSSTVSRMKNDNASPDDLLGSSNPDDDDLYKAWTTYQKMLEDQNALDFDDLLLKTLHLLTESEQARNYYQDRIHHLSVDEFQDTNLVQAAIIKKFAPAYIVESDDRSLFLVGDMDQSIYAFRGAKPQLLATIEQSYPKIKILYLPINYRSTANIVDLSKNIIAGNLSDIRADLTTENPTGPKTRMVLCDDSYREAEWVVGDMQRRGLAPEDVAIIYRTNFQSRGFEMELKRNRIPHKIIGGMRFYDRTEIKDLVAYLRLIYNHKDAAAFLRCANIPRRAMSDAACQEVLDYATENNLDIYESLEHLKNSKSRRKKAFANLHEFLFGLEGKTPDEVIKHVMDSGYRTMITKMEKPAERIENISELVGHINTFTGEDQIGAFLEEAALLSSEDENDEVGCVTLMTGHASKGKEFKNVYVVAVQDGSFPHSMTETVDEYEEERRLLFVAVSRAMETLTLTAQMRNRNNDDVDASPFTVDIDDDLVTYPSELVKYWWKGNNTF